MELWVAITFAAAFVQNIRSALQKYLKGAMGTTGATFVRFGFGVPFALLFLAIAVAVLDLPIPAVHTTFFLWVVLASIAAQLYSLDC